MGSTNEFPKDFLIGVATSAYQIEGGWNEEGKGENIWDREVHTNPDKIHDHKNADIACDSYHLYKEDVKLIKEIGFAYYRFSVSWSRILPDGKKNNVNDKGIQYYHNLIDELLKEGVTPMITIYHWDLPQKLQDEGGWMNRKIVEYFEDYARILFTNYGDKVKMWFTINAPKIITQSYGDTILPPRLNQHGTAEYIVGHNLLLSHAAAYRLYEKEFKPLQNGKVSIVLETIFYLPKTENISDKEATERALIFSVGWFADPIYSKQGDYPAIMRERVDENSRKEGRTQSRLPHFTQEEIKMIRGSSDIFAFQMYTSKEVKTGEEGKLPSILNDMGVSFSINENWKSSTVPWLKIVPEGLRAGLNWIRVRYGNPPVFITENGYGDIREEDGLRDEKRIDYFTGHLKAVLDAIKIDKCNVKAYTIWSLMDNFEWNAGFSQSFGIYQVDFNDPKRKRTPKKSAEIIKNIISKRRLLL